MAEELREGLDLAVVGMVLVFLTLVIFMLILFALRKLFPGEEVVEDVETDEVTAKVGVTEGAQQVSVQPIVATTQEPPATVVAASGGSMSGGKIAAMAVAIYLAMEQEESAANTPVSTATVGTFPSRRGWSNLGRSSLWESQGRRPQAYGEKSHSAYPPKDRVR